MYWELIDADGDVFADILDKNYDEVESNTVSTFTLHFRKLTAEELRAIEVIKR